jgi:hypothetical protein
MECPCSSFIVLLAQVVNRDIRVGLAHYNIRILFPSVCQLMFAIVEEQQPSSKCISDLKDRLSQAYHLATEAAQKAREKQKEGYMTSELEAQS